MKKRAMMDFNSMKAVRGRRFGIGVFGLMLALFFNNCLWAAPNTTGPLTGVVIDTWNHKPKCQKVHILFDPVSSYLGHPIVSFRLYRNSHLVKEIGLSGIVRSYDATETHPAYGLSDSRFEPATGMANSYQVSAVNDQGQESPLSEAVSFTPTWSFCKAATNLKTLVVIPVLPAGVAAKDLVTDARLSELFMSGPLSVANYFKEVSRSRGQCTWGGPATSIWSQQQLPKSIEEYTANGTVSIYDSKAFDQDLNKIRTTIQAINRTLYADRTTAFVFVVMGSGGGGTSGNTIITLAGGNMLPQSTTEKALRAVIHELGHRLGLLHAGTVGRATADTPNCTASEQLPFGSDPISSVRNCRLSQYSDYGDAMGTGVRLYSAYSRKLLFGTETEVIDQASSPKSRSLRLYASSFSGVNPHNWGGANAQIVQFRLTELDPAGHSSYYIEYRTVSGFDDPAATMSSYAPRPGISVRFRPGFKIFSGDPEIIHTYLAATGNSDYAVVGEGQTKTFDTATGLTINVAKVTADYADVLLTWK